MNLFNKNLTLLFQLLHLFQLERRKKERLSLQDAGNQFYKDLFSEYYEGICTYLLRYTTDPDEIEDAVQEAFVILWEKRKKIEIRSSVKSYLYRLAYNNLMNIFREKQKTKSLINDYYYTKIHQITDSENENDTSQIRKLKECLEALPKRCMEIFKATKLAGLSYRKVAENYGISLKTVEGHVTSGYKFLRECMVR